MYIIKISSPCMKIHWYAAFFFKNIFFKKLKIIRECYNTQVCQTKAKNIDLVLHRKWYKLGNSHEDELRKKPNMSSIISIPGKPLHSRHAIIRHRTVYPQIRKRHSSQLHSSWFWTLIQGQYIFNTENRLTQQLPSPPTPNRKRSSTEISWNIVQNKKKITP